MGVYLSEPKTQKETKTDTSNYIRYTSAEMQGWRKNMEDSKITELNVNINNKRYCVFGVFDGHGGTGFVMQEWRYPNL
jgi:serine/threonine protein phosphatase PrpC